MSQQLPPTPEQAAAIAARDSDVFCEAGAGSGKTRVLVGRYCDAVCDDGVEIDQILAFTFTERAAAELRQRIRAELTARSRAAKEAGDESRAAWLRARARETERAWVTTIHGFCRRLLGTHPVAAGLDPRFRVLDAPEAERLRERAAREAIERLVAEGDERLERVVAAYRSWRIGAIVLTAHERLRSQGMAKPALPEVGLPERSHRKDSSPLSADEAKAALDARAVLQQALEAVGEHYEELKAGRSGLDFADLELRTVELLRSSAAVAATWRERFRHVMVDEFQDTNRVQLELIDRLRGPETRLFTVGDEHQSIYRFRNADLEVFRAERARAQDSPWTRLLPLRGNFRSRPEVLAVANALGGTLLDGFTPLTAGRGSAGDGVRAELLLTFEEGKGKEHRQWKAEGIELEPPPSEGNWATVAQARALAERLRELVDSGQARPEDIVVLLRAFTHVDAYEDALRRFGLEPYVVGGRGYWSQQQVEDLLRLLGVVANPLDDELLFGALASPACEVTPDALWLLRQATGERRHVWPTLAAAFGDEDGEWEPAEPERLEAIGADDAERLRDFWRTVAALRAEAAVTPLDALVERTMNAFGYDLALLARPQGAGRMANVRKLMRLAAEFEGNEGRDLRAFLAQAGESTRRDEREGQAPVQAEDYPGVRIMTVHGAKGLEASVVILIDGCDVLGRDPPLVPVPLGGGHRAMPVWSPGRAHDCAVLAAAREALRGRALEEHNRLLYVAMTRAKDRLVLAPYAGSRKDAAAEAWCEMIRRGLIATARGLVIAEAPFGPVEIWTEHDTQPRVTAAAAGPAPARIELPDWLRQPADAEPEPTPPVRPSSAIAAADRLHRLGDRAYAPAARLRGTLTHALLEHLPGIAEPKRDAVAHAFVMARAPRLAPDVRAGIVAAALGVLGHEALRPLFGNGSRAEVAIAGTLRIGGVDCPVSGQIDRLAVLDDEVLLADYKTTANPPGPGEPAPSSYVAQLGLYRALLGDIDPHRPVRAFLIWTAGPLVQELSADELGRALEAVEAA